MENAAGVRFILKYGVAIIVILIIIFLINKFDLYNTIFAPEDCDIRSGFECISFSAHKDGVNIIIQNLHDYTVFVSEIQFMECLFSGRQAMNPGITRSFHLKNCIIEGKIKDILKIRYFSPDNLPHQINGTLVVKVK